MTTLTIIAYITYVLVCAALIATGLLWSRLSEFPRRYGSFVNRPTEKRSQDEIRKLETVLETEYAADHVADIIDQDMTGLTTRVFGLMIHPRRRVKQPDPILRYKSIIDYFSKRSRGRKDAIVISHIPRFFILRLTLTHLKANVNASTFGGC